MMHACVCANEMSITSPLKSLGSSFFRCTVILNDKKTDKTIPNKIDVWTEYDMNWIFDSELKWCINSELNWGSIAKRSKISFWIPIGFQYKLFYTAFNVESEEFALFIRSNGKIRFEINIPLWLGIKQKIDNVSDICSRRCVGNHNQLSMKHRQSKMVFGFFETKGKL